MRKVTMVALSFAALAFGSQARAVAPAMDLFTFTANDGAISYTWESLASPSPTSSNDDSFYVRQCLGIY